jgi:hypothetical protein
MFSPAPQPELVRAVQKDRLFVGQLREELDDVASFIPRQWARQHEAEIELLVNSAYYGLTSLMGTHATRVRDLVRVQWFT